MTIADKKRLEELDNKWKLVYKGTGKTFEVEAWPGGVETWIDDDRYEWTGTEDEKREYNALSMEQTKERMIEASNGFKKMLATALYGGKKICHKKYK